MVDNLEGRNVIPESSRGIGEKLARDVKDFLDGRGEYSHLKRRRKICEERGNHKKPIQQIEYPNPYFDNILPHEVLIPMHCKYCQTFYHRGLTSKEIEQQYRRQERFLKLMEEPFMQLSPL